MKLQINLQRQLRKRPKEPEVTNPVTALDIKTAVQESCNIKWQKRWEAGATGRHLFDLRPSVNVQTVPVQRELYLNSEQGTAG